MRRLAMTSAATTRILTHATRTIGSTGDNFNVMLHECVVNECSRHTLHFEHTHTWDNNGQHSWISFYTTAPSLSVLLCFHSKSTDLNQTIASHWSRMYWNSWSLHTKTHPRCRIELLTCWKYVIDGMLWLHSDKWRYVPVLFDECN